MTHTEYCILLIKIGYLQFRSDDVPGLLHGYQVVDKKFPYWNQPASIWSSLITSINPASVPLTQRLTELHGVETVWHEFIGRTNRTKLVRKKHKRT